MYGVSYMYGPNLLMFNTEVVTPAPTSWDITLEPSINGQPNPYKGKLTSYDDHLHRGRRDVPDDPRPGPEDHDPYELARTSWTPRSSC